MGDITVPLDRNKLKNISLITNASNMGFDTYNVYILFGVKIPEDDILRVLNTFYPDLNEIIAPRLSPG